MKIMVCGSIGYGGLSRIREIQSLLKKSGFTVIDHVTKDMDYSSIKDFRDKEELAEKIVDHDLDFVKKSDIIVAISDRPSYGTAIEMLVAKELGKKVILLSEKEVPTPWPIAFSNHIVKNKEELISILNRIERRHAESAPSDENSRSES